MTAYTDGLRVSHSANAMRCWVPDAAGAAGAAAGDGQSPTDGERHAAIAWIVVCILAVAGAHLAALVYYHTAAILVVDTQDHSSSLMRCCSSTTTSKVEPTEEESTITIHFTNGTEVSTAFL